MWQASGECSRKEKLLFYKIKTAPGQSGSPIIKRENGKEYVVGIHIGERNREKKATNVTNVAIRLTQAKRAMINEWVSEVTFKFNLRKFEFILGFESLKDEPMKELAEKLSTKIMDLNLSNQ